jgi:hypothetical protein
MPAFFSLKASKSLPSQSARAAIIGRRTRASVFELQEMPAERSKRGPDLKPLKQSAFALLIAPLAVPLVSCAAQQAAQQRAEIAHEAQDKMIGLPKEQVLACMGIPAN